jgi:FkbM family methyltransferase
MLVNPHDFYVGRAVLEYGEYGEIEGQFLMQLLSWRPGKVIEAGANIGTHSVPLAKALAREHRELVVFEPQPFIFQNLCANLALNGITNVRAWPWACGAQAGTVYFPQPDYAAEGNFGGVSMKENGGQGNIAVPCVRLDDVIGDDPVGLIKIDVEGFELLALQGAEGILNRSRPVLYVENDRPEKSRALIEWLWSRNYRLWWHGPDLYNPENFFGEENNLYPHIVSGNMLALPKELDFPIENAHEITDSGFHPLRRE